MAAFGSPEYWHERANEAREYLKDAHDPLLRRQMEEIIETYERLAKEAKTP